jgi:DNA-binding transcriptional MerR regulator
MTVLYSPFRTVPDTPTEIPNRAAFKASEVCEIAQIPPYVLRSWEKEFPGLGAVGRPGGPRIYRREDIGQILRIKQLVFTEGLTLSGARRKLEGEPAVEEFPVEIPPAGVPEAVKTRVAEARKDLRDLLMLLSTPVAKAGGEPAPGWPPGTGKSKAHASRRDGSQRQGDLPLLEDGQEPAGKAPAARRGAAAKRK